jgi:hypothetical protein
MKKINVLKACGSVGISTGLVACSIISFMDASFLDSAMAGSAPVPVPFSLPTTPSVVQGGASAATVTTNTSTGITTTTLPGGASVSISSAGGGTITTGNQVITVPPSVSSSLVTPPVTGTTTAGVAATAASQATNELRQNVIQDLVIPPNVSEATKADFSSQISTFINATSGLFSGGDISQSRIDSLVSLAKGLTDALSNAGVTPPPALRDVLSVINAFKPTSSLGVPGSFQTITPINSGSDFRSGLSTGIR